MRRSNATRLLTRVCLLMLVTGAWVAQAQSQAEAAREPFLERFDFGVRVGGLPLKLISPHTVTTSRSTEDVPEVTYEYSRNASQRFSAGPTVGIRLSDKFALNLDFLYKRLGYDSGIQTGPDVTDPPDNQFDVIESERYERTRADLWDISIMGRRYNHPYYAYGPRMYVNAGVSIRTVTGIKSFRETVNRDVPNDTTSVPVDPTRRFSAGVIAGGGVQFEDEIGLKLEIEGRFTRWLQRAFDNGAIRTNNNQVEVMVGLTF